MDLLKRPKVFIQKVINRFSSKKPLDNINGVFFGGDHFLRVVDQPSGKPEYISNNADAVTRFQLATNYGNVGLIAHNYLSGRYFGDLHVGDRIYTMDGYGKQSIYQVTRIRRFQALNPRSARSDFIDLDTRQRMTVNDVFRQVYTGSHHLTLQTCIQNGGDQEWGRLFIIAEPTINIPPAQNSFRQNP